MTDHLPECSYDPEELKWFGECGEPHDGHCICDRLRACEERVIQSAINIARQRQIDLLSCTKDDNCHIYAYMADVIASDIEYILMRNE